METALDYDSEDYQRYLQRKRLERQRKLLGDKAPPDIEEIVEETAKTEPAVAVDNKPPINIPPVYAIKDPGGSGS